MLGSQRSHEDPDGLGIRWREVRAEGLGNVPATVEEFQRLETAAGVIRESTNSEWGMHARDVGGKAADERR